MAFPCALGAAPTEADDLLQDTLLVALQKGLADRGPAAAASFLRQTAQHLFLRRRRDQGRRAVILAGLAAVRRRVGQGSCIPDHPRGNDHRLQRVRPGKGAAGGSADCRVPGIPAPRSAQRADRDHLSTDDGPPDLRESPLPQRRLARPTATRRRAYQGSSGSGGARAGASGDGSPGRPRCARICRIATWSKIAANRRAASAATPDGLGITAVDTARMLISKAKEQQRDDLAARADARLAKLDPALLEPPAYERNLPGARRGGRRR